MKLISHDTARDILYAKLVYLTLTMSLLPAEVGGLGQNQEQRAVIQRSEEVLKNPGLKDADILQLQEEISTAFDRMKKLFPLKCGIKKIAYEYKENYQKNSTFENKSIPLGQLRKWMDLAVLPYPEDLPHHTQIGLLQYAGETMMAEDEYLQDAFLMLARAERCDSITNTSGHNHHLGQSQSAYARLGIHSFHRFIEAFIKGITYDYDCDFEGETEEIHKNALKEAEKQLAESNSKLAMQSPEEWLTMLLDTAKQSLESAKQIWQVFYNEKDFPEYLCGLDYDKLRSAAQEKLEFEKKY